MKTNQKLQRKLLLFIPLLVLPFLALAFYAMGGGRNKHGNRIENNGINTSLPNAKFKKEEPKDKLGFYADALRETSKNDDSEIRDVANHLGFKNEDPQTEQINQKLEALNKEINRPAQASSSRTFNTQSAGSITSIKSDVDRLEVLMRNMQKTDQHDPEMEQLSSMIDKILDLQHPERLQEKYETKALSSPDSQFQAIPAIVDENQKVTQGSLIRLRLKDTIILKGQIFPKGHLIFGNCMLSNQRILLDIRTIRLGMSIIPVNLSVYSMDGMKGLNAPEAVLSESAASGATDLISNIPSWATGETVSAQVAGAGLDAAKALFRKKLKRIKIKLTAGQTVLLRNNESLK